MGFGSISIIKDETTILPDLSVLLYIVPIIAFAFDMYILREDFGIKRAGGFLGRKVSKASDEERAWEGWVSNNRDLFSKMAGPLLSILVLFASSAVIWFKSQTALYFKIWIGMNVLFGMSIFLYSHKANDEINKMTNNLGACRT